MDGKFHFWRSFHLLPQQHRIRASFGIRKLLWIAGATPTQKPNRRKCMINGNKCLYWFVGIQLNEPYCIFHQFFTWKGEEGTLLTSDITYNNMQLHFIRRISLLDFQLILLLWWCWWKNNVETSFEVICKSYFDIIFPPHKLHRIKSIRTQLKLGHTGVWWWIFMPF